MSHFIAIDIGGTQMRAGCYQADSHTPSKLDRISTQFPGSTPLDRLVDLVSVVWPEDNNVAAIGLAAPGPVDPYAGVLREAPNIPGWFDVPLKAYLEEIFHIPVALGNDANLAALGEWKFGAGIGHHDLVYLTVSTGIGGGVIINDRLLLGQKGLAAELGHITILPGGPMCGCGHRGHLEAIASGPAMARWVEEELAKGAISIIPGDIRVTAKMVGEAAREGDLLAITALQRTGTFVGIAVANYVNIFNPSIVIIGGGVSRSGDIFMETVGKTMEESVFNPYYLENLTLVPAALGDSAGLMGALALAHEFYKNTMQQDCLE
ncbi:MAG: ROK family protein [Chloroflexi bacterium]|nr:MAG: ROK family protein [Chloroflexota bacterium]